MLNMANEKAISIQEAARRLGVSEQTIRRQIKDGHIRSFRVGWQVRIPESEIRRIMEGGDEMDQDRRDE